MLEEEGVWLCFADAVGWRRREPGDFSKATYDDVDTAPPGHIPMDSSLILERIWARAEVGVA